MRTDPCAGLFHVKHRDQRAPRIRVSHRRRLSRGLRRTPSGRRPNRADRTARPVPGAGCDVSRETSHPDAARSSAHVPLASVRTRRRLGAARSCGATTHWAGTRCLGAVGTRPRSGRSARCNASRETSVHGRRTVAPAAISNARQRGATRRRSAARAQQGRATGHLAGPGRGRGGAVRCGGAAHGRPEPPRPALVRTVCVQPLRGVPPEPAPPELQTCRPGPGRWTPPPADRGGSVQLTAPARRCCVPAARHPSLRRRRRCPDAAPCRGLARTGRLPCAALACRPAGLCSPALRLEAQVDGEHRLLEHVTAVLA